MEALSKVHSRYGAPMGRPSSAALSGRVRLSRVRLNRGGYDDGGAYWGHGQPLWRAEDADGEQRFLRAPDRAAAKAQIPGCSFYR